MADNTPISKTVLEISDLNVAFRAGTADLVAVRNVDFEIKEGEAVGLVGESGSGKTTLALAIMGYLGPAGFLQKGKIVLEGVELSKMSEKGLRNVRGSRIAMIYQEPMSSLNPLMTIGQQVAEVPMIHGGSTRRQAREQSVKMLGEVDLPDPEGLLQRYPHQLSGGQQQRVVIAMALIAKPVLLIMDEPTTALDVTVEAGVLDLVKDLRRRHRMAILFISHNLRTVAQVCDRVSVMYAGDIVEQGRVSSVFRAPAHPYTAGLLDCLPSLDSPKHGARLHSIPGQVPPPSNRTVPCMFMERCDYGLGGRCDRDHNPLRSSGQDNDHLVRCIRLDELPANLTDIDKDESETSVGASNAEGAPTARPVLTLRAVSKRFSQARGLFQQRSRSVTALDQINLDIEGNQTLAVVGESGSGKSTLARAICGLTTADSGSIQLADVEIGNVALDHRSTFVKRKLQMVFQNPDSILNPSHSVGFALERTIRRLEDRTKSGATKEVKRMLNVVRLPDDYDRRFPDQLSGGQKQRVGIARALIGTPEILLADEPVSSLDVSVQAAIINLLSELQVQYEMTLIFISHDLSVVRHIADKVAVMYLGQVVEAGLTNDIFEPPYHPYTEALLSAVPRLMPGSDDQRIILDSPTATSAVSSNACPFAARCPRKLGTICDDQKPPKREFGNGHFIVCHIADKDFTTHIGQGFDHTSSGRDH
jgi:peptide/nickel transport system ATP-binding protein